MPSSVSRKRNRSALSGEGRGRSHPANGKAAGATSFTRLRLLTVVLLVTTIVLIGYHIHRYNTAGKLPSTLRTFKETIRQWTAENVDEITYDSSQWKARVKKVAKLDQTKLTEKIENFKENLINLKNAVPSEQNGGSNKESLESLMKDMSMEDIQSMFDALNDRGAYRNAAEDPAAPEGGRTERFARLKNAIKHADEL